MTQPCCDDDRPEGLEKKENEMAEYNIGFSEKLIDAAEVVAVKCANDVDAIRAVLYLSSLASEIALKALLEKAGISVKEIKARGHSLRGLLTDLGKCQIQDEFKANSHSWVPATRLRARLVDARYSDATVGKILTGEEIGASKYPNELRYGDHIKDYPPKLKLNAAKVVIGWAKEHLDDIRLKPSGP